MTGKRQLASDRAPTGKAGPRTAAGKARSARNALRHGLSLRFSANPTLAARDEDLARQICGPTNDPTLLNLSRQIAEAQAQLERVRSRRHALIMRAYNDLGYRPRDMARQWLKMATALTKGALTNRRLAIYDGKFRPLAPPKQGPLKLALILGDAHAELASLERYERRALSRRKSSIRRFDALAKVKL
jgi:hypothetical protein